MFELGLGTGSFHPPKQPAIRARERTVGWMLVNSLVRRSATVAYALRLTTRIATYLFCFSDRLSNKRDRHLQQGFELCWKVRRW